MTHLRLLFTLALVGSACTAPSKDASSTRTVAAPPAKAIPDDPMDRRTAVDQGYSLISATMKIGDLAMVAGLYAPDALLMLPDSMVRGAQNIAARLGALAQSKSMADFQRSSLGMTVIDDSTLADSGSYLMILKRTPTDSVLERGRYRALWRARTGTGNWVMLEDHITPPAGKKQGAK